MTDLNEARWLSRSQARSRTRLTKRVRRSRSRVVWGPEGWPRVAPQVPRDPGGGIWAHRHCGGHPRADPPANEPSSLATFGAIDSQTSRLGTGLQDQGELDRDRHDEGRPSDCDIDPSFPSDVDSWEAWSDEMLPRSEMFPTKQRGLVRWIEQGPVPKVESILQPEILPGARPEASMGLRDRGHLLRLQPR